MAKHTEGNAVHKEQDFEKYIVKDPVKNKIDWVEQETTPLDMAWGTGMLIIYGVMFFGSILIVFFSWAFGLFDLYK